MRAVDSLATHVMDSHTNGLGPVSSLESVHACCRGGQPAVVCRGVERWSLYSSRGSSPKVGGRRQHTFTVSLFKHVAFVRWSCPPPVGPSGGGRMGARAVATLVVCSFIARPAHAPCASYCSRYTCDSSACNVCGPDKGCAGRPSTPYGALCMEVRPCLRAPQRASRVRVC